MEIYKQKIDSITFNITKDYDGEDELTPFISSLKKLKGEINKPGYNGIKFNKKEKKIWDKLFEVIEDETLNNN